MICRGPSNLYSLSPRRPMPPLTRVFAKFHRGYCARSIFALECWKYRNSKALFRIFVLLWLLRRGESVRADGKYQFKYHINGKPHFFYSWRLEPADKLLKGKKPGLSLREKEKRLGYDLATLSDPLGKKMIVAELVERYLSTKIGVKPNTLTNYNFVKNLLAKEEFSEKALDRLRHQMPSCFWLSYNRMGKDIVQWKQYEVF